MSKAIVLYTSRGGNTEKVATQIAEGLNADLGKKKEVPNLDNYDLVVVGTWPMMGKISGPGKRLLNKVAKKITKPTKVAIFFTAGGPDKVFSSDEEVQNDPNAMKIKDVVINAMEKILSQNKNITLLKERYYCIGALRMFGKIVDGEGHPSDEELAQAKAFGEKLKNTLA